MKKESLGLPGQRGAPTPTQCLGKGCLEEVRRAQEEEQWGHCKGRGGKQLGVGEGGS